MFNNSLYPDPGEKKEERENLKNVVSGVLVIDKPIGAPLLFSFGIKTSNIVNSSRTEKYRIINQIINVLRSSKLLI